MGECSRVVDGPYPFTPTARSTCRSRDFGRLFGSAACSTSSSEKPRARSWTVAEAVDVAARRGRTVRGRCSHQFEKRAADPARCSSAGVGSAELRFIVTLEQADVDVQRFCVEIDGQTIEIAPPARTVLSIWPGPSRGSRRAVNVVRAAFGGQPRDVVPSGRGPGSG